MKYLLDTCVLSEFIKAEPSAAVQAWLARQHEADLFMSALSLAELQRGVERLAPGRRRTELTGWLAQLLRSFDDRILPFTPQSALCWGRLCAAAESRGRPLALMDSLIAVAALEHSLTLVTRNLKDFTAAPITLLNPWLEPA